MAHALTHFFQQQWQKISVWHGLLIPLSSLFWLISSLRRSAYKLGIFKSYKVTVPVIVIGNINIGGTGKTPVVIWLAKRLKEVGYKPAIISRGYGGASSGEVLPDGLASIFGDEPVLLAQRTGCPVWVGRDRVATAKALLQKHPECDLVLSDDGLQHYRLQRDVEIAVIDGVRGFGNHFLLPAGPLRESTSRLTSVDVVVQHGGDQLDEKFNLHTFKMHLDALMFHQLINPQNTKSAKDFANKNTLAIAGIGHPERFFKQLSSMGLQFEQQAFPDHHPFQPHDLQNKKAELVLMTEKDAVKCKQFAQPHWWYLAVEANIDKAMLNHIVDKLRK